MCAITKYHSTSNRETQCLCCHWCLTWKALIKVFGMHHFYVNTKNDIPWTHLNAGFPAGAVISLQTTLHSRPVPYKGIERKLKVQKCERALKSHLANNPVQVRLRTPLEHCQLHLVPFLVLRNRQINRVIASFVLLAAEKCILLSIALSIILYCLSCTLRQQKLYKITIYSYLDWESKPTQDHWLPV